MWNDPCDVCDLPEITNWATEQYTCPLCGQQWEREIYDDIGMVWLRVVNPKVDR